MPLAIVAVSLGSSAVAATTTVAADASWKLLPQPSSVRLAPAGAVTIGDGAVVALRGPDRDALQPVVEGFRRRVADTRGLHLKLATTADARAAITFELDDGAPVVGESGYRLVVADDGIRITARTTAGAFYGGVSLWQLLTAPGVSRGSAAVIAKGTIEDQPRFAWRGLLLDSGRHFQSVVEIERLIEAMSLEKLNVLVWHLTEDQGWRLEIPKYPALTRLGACREAKGLDAELTGSPGRPYCGHYSEADVRELVRYAAERFVTIVPEIDLPGHSQAAVAAYPWLGVTGERPPVWTDWGVSPWLLKPDERTLGFVNDVLDEVMRLFPSRYVSIGGDEAEKSQWNASPELRARLAGLGLSTMDELQGWFVGRVAAHLVEHGRTPVGWDDLLAAGVALPPSQVVMSWHGNDGQRVARTAAAAGHEVVLTPEDSLYFDHFQSNLPDEGPGQPPLATLRQAYDTATIPRDASAAEAARVIGVQGSLWTELVPDEAHGQHALYPRLAALAELGWSPAADHDWNGFLERLTAELARYRALGIGYADSAFAPTFDVRAGAGGTLRVSISNAAGFGKIRYTTDGSIPTAASALYERPLELSADERRELRAATFASGGFELSAPRTQPLAADVLRRRDSSELASCSDRPGMRLEGRRPATGPRPVYTVYVGDMCWLWRQAPAPAGQVTLRVERLAWRFGDEARDAVARQATTTAGEFEVHAGGCAGPALARLSLAPVVRDGGAGELRARVPVAATTTARDLCIFATGDPREGPWALGRIAFTD
ncbi:MAG: family 20 glycosylhydrolase [Proteobacteria bacterium]|nr:family 20 glycosylhydrolase [Pseudomonadota bacterium]